MTKPKATNGRLLLLSMSIPLAIGCGSGPPPPASPEPPPSAADAEAEAEAEAAAVAAAVAESEANEAGEATPSPGTEPPEETEAAAAPNAPPIVEVKDECTPVGVDFEKRARPKVKACYAEGKKKDPNLEGTVKIKIDVDFNGKIKSTKIVENTLPQPVANCMLKVIKATPFPDVDKCWNASLTIPVTFPTPR